MKNVAAEGGVKGNGIKTCHSIGTGGFADRTEDGLGRSYDLQINGIAADLTVNVRGGETGIVASIGPRFGKVQSAGDGGVAGSGVQRLSEGTGDQEVLIGEAGSAARAVKTSLDVSGDRWHENRAPLQTSLGGTAGRAVA